MQVNVRRKRHSSCVNLEDLVPSHLVRDAYLDFSVEPFGSSQSRIYSVGPVRCTNDDNVSTRTHPIHQRQELSDASSLYLSSDFFSLRRYRVHLIDEYDARSSLLRLLENLSQPSLRLAVEL